MATDAWDAVKLLKRSRLIQTLMLPISVPTVRWQVPSGWMNRRTSAAQVVIWGASLGPGLITRNPYASMWLLPLLLPLIGDWHLGVTVGIIAGGSHGL